MPGVGIIGLGSFGMFMAGHLARHIDVLAHDPRQQVVPPGVRWVSLEEAARQPIVILAVPVQAIEELLQEIAPWLEPGALVMDVASVKMMPVKLLEKYVPDTCEIMATHPLFGPQSGANGIVGLTVVTWPVRVGRERYEAVQEWLGDRLGLQVTEIDPEEHDREMAYVQALTFFVGEALGDLDIPETPLKTATYQHLLDLRRLVAANSPALRETIHEHNPYAKAVREKLVRRLEQIESEFEG